MNEVRLKILDMIAKDAASCSKCILHESRVKSVFNRGSGNIPLMLVGEAPGKDENEQGLPFVGRSGKLLDNMIKAMGFDRNDIYIANICKCRPPSNRRPQPEEIEACIDYLKMQIELVNPDVIVALGSTATESLLGPGEGITKRRGKIYNFDNRKIICTFHPAYLLRNPAAKADVRDDLAKVLKIING